MEEEFKFENLLSIIKSNSKLNNKLINEDNFTIIKNNFQRKTIIQHLSKDYMLTYHKHGGFKKVTLVEILKSSFSEKLFDLFLSNGESKDEIKKELICYENIYNGEFFMLFYESLLHLILYKDVPEHVGEIDKIFYNETKNKLYVFSPYYKTLHSYLHQNLNSLFFDISFFTKRKREEKVKEKIQEVEFFIYEILYEIILTLEKFQSLNFIHGDLKFNNILYDIDEFGKIKLRFIDFGNSYIKINEENEFHTQMFKHILHHDEKNEMYCDFSFFILTFYIYFDYFVNKKFENDYETILRTSFLEELYDKTTILSIKEIEKIIKEIDEFSLYYNNKKLFEILEPEKYDQVMKIYQMKFSLKDNYKEIIKNKLKIN